MEKNETQSVLFNQNINSESFRINKSKNKKDIKSSQKKILNSNVKSNPKLDTNIILKKNFTEISKVHSLSKKKNNNNLIILNSPFNNHLVNSTNKNELKLLDKSSLFKKLNENKTNTQEKLKYNVKKV